MVVKPAVRTSDSSTAVPLTIHCARASTTTLFGVVAINSGSALIISEDELGRRREREVTAPLHGSFLSLPAAMANLFMAHGC